MKRYRYLLGLVALLTGCSEEQSTIDIGGDGRIEFEANMSVLTRATDTAFVNGDKIGVYATAWKEGVPELLSGNRYSNMDNACFIVGENGQLYNAGATVYWPIDNRALDFYSYYPYREEALANGITRYSVSVATDQRADSSYASSDFMTSIVTNVTKQDVVHLPFNHAFSKLILRLKLNGSYSQADLLKSSLRILNMSTTAVVDLSVDMHHAGFLTDASIRQTLIPHGRWVAEEDSALQRLVGISAIVVPQLISPGTPLFELITPDGQAYQYKAAKGKNLFESGTAYLFTMEIGKTYPPDPPDPPIPPDPIDPIDPPIPPDPPTPPTRLTLNAIEASICTWNLGTPIDDNVSEEIPKGYLFTIPTSMKGGDAYKVLYGGQVCVARFSAEKDLNNSLQVTVTAVRADEMTGLTLQCRPGDRIYLSQDRTKISLDDGSLLGATVSLILE